MLIQPWMLKKNAVPYECLLVKMKKNNHATCTFFLYSLVTYMYQWLCTNVCIASLELCIGWHWVIDITRAERVNPESSLKILYSLLATYQLIWCWQILRPHIPHRPQCEQFRPPSAMSCNVMTLLKVAEI